MKKVSVDVREVLDERYGNCVSISNGSIKALVTIDYGPEIVFFGKQDGNNLLYASESSEENMFVSHHVWDSNREYIPQKLPVVYSLLKDGASFSTVSMPEKDLKFKMDIIMNNDSQDMMVIHSIKSLSKDEITMSVLSSTLVAQNGTTILPQSSAADRNAPNRMVSFWPYSKVGDKRFSMSDRYIKVAHDAGNEDKFRLGINDCDGWVLHVIGENAFAQRFVHNEKALYPNFGSSVSVFTDADATSVETVSPLYNLKNRDTVNHVESWSIFDIKSKASLNEDKDIDDLLNNLQ